MSDATTLEETKLTVGLDLGDRHIQVRVLDEAGEVIEEARLRHQAGGAAPPLLRRRSPAHRAQAGTDSRWVSRLLAELGTR